MGLGESEKKLKLTSEAINALDDKTSKILTSRLYFAYFGFIPSSIRLNGLSFSKCLAHIKSKYSEQIVNTHIKKYFNTEDEILEADTIIFVLANQIILEMVNGLGFFGKIEILFNQKNEGEAHRISEEMIIFKEENSKPNHIHLVIPARHGGLDKAAVKVNKPKLKLEIHYNDDLGLLHSNILKKLKSKKESGLFLFHGNPGTGKSTYIRHLIHSVKKDVIFISPKFAGNLDSPDFTKFLIDNPNSIFVIEDAENLIVSRDSENNSAISMILNLTDGLLGEGLGIQFICTFNTHLSRIDKALMRKGRLKCLYEFSALNVQKSNHLLESLMLSHKATQPMTLAEIYNLKEETFEFNETKRFIGFDT